MSKTPICDKHKYETDLGAEVVPFHVAIELELKLHQRELEIGEANAKWLRSDKQLAEVRADADHWKSECNALQRMVHEARAEIDGLTLMATNASMEPARRLIQKNKELHAVIEQMREALRLALPEARSTHVEQTILAALAAERGE